MRRILGQKFFARTAPEVARDLLGKYIVRNIRTGDGVESGSDIEDKKDGKEKGVAYMITETEAYEGLDDLASHAARGKTARTEVMFGPPGVLYVYFVYGMHNMLNVVTGTNGHPSAVLIRSAQIATGPGRLTKALHITRELNALPASRQTGVWFEDRGVIVAEKDIICTPRIGVDYAGPVWSQKPWRFVYDAHKNLSDGTSKKNP